MERIPTWVIDDTSGASSGEPSAWISADDEHGTAWSRQDLIPFGRANPLYRRRHFVCPECESMLRPMRRRGFFACVGCLLAFQWEAGRLSGYGQGSPLAISVLPAEFNFR